MKLKKKKIKHQYQLLVFSPNVFEITVESNYRLLLRTSGLKITKYLYYTIYNK